MSWTSWLGDDNSFIGISLTLSVWNYVDRINNIWDTWLAAIFQKQLFHMKITLQPSESLKWNGMSGIRSNKFYFLKTYTFRLYSATFDSKDGLYFQALLPIYSCWNNNCVPSYLHKHFKISWLALQWYQGLVVF